MAKICEKPKHIPGNGSKFFTFKKRVLKYKKSPRIQRQCSLFGHSLDLCQKCAEWGIKELSWAELGRRVGHKKLRGEGEGVNVREPAIERGGLKERFSVGTGTWWLGVDGKRKGKEGTVDLSSNCKLCSERKQECGSAWE